MGDFRARRISQVLGSAKNHDVASVQKLHYDTYSLQAEEYLKILRPLLGESPNEQILADWNCEYDLASVGASVFEAWYRELYGIVFGKGDNNAAELMWREGGIFIDFYQNFDRVLQSKKSVWFKNKGREAIYKEALDRIKSRTFTPWGETNRFVLKHLLFGGKFPRFMGFDHRLNTDSRRSRDGAPGPDLPFSGARHFVHTDVSVRHRFQRTGAALESARWAVRPAVR